MRCEVRVHYRLAAFCAQSRLCSQRWGFYVFAPESLFVLCRIIQKSFLVHVLPI